MNQLRPCLISYTARGQAISKPRHHARQDLLHRSARSVVLGVAAELGDDKEVGWLYLQKERTRKRKKEKGRERGRERERENEGEKGRGGRGQRRGKSRWREKRSWLSGSYRSTQALTRRGARQSPTTAIAWMRVLWSLVGLYVRLVKTSDGVDLHHARNEQARSPRGCSPYLGVVRGATGSPSQEGDRGGFRDVAAGAAGGSCAAGQLINVLYPIFALFRFSPGFGLLLLRRRRQRFYTAPGRLLHR